MTGGPRENGQGVLRLSEGATVHDLHRAFEQTEYGQVLVGNVRYHGFMPEGMANDEWERLFGADVNNLRHLPLTHGLTRAFLRHCAEPHAGWRGPVPEEAVFSEPEAELMEVGAMVHDWAESIVLDTLYWKKTAQHEAEESAAFKALMEEILPKDHELAEKIVRAVTEVVEDRTTKLGRAFNAVERVGYVRTALRSWEHHHDAADDELRTRLRWLTHNVLANQIGPLVEYGQTYPAVDEFLAANRDRLVPAFSEIAEDFIELYEGKHEKYGRMFVASREVYFVRYLSVD